MKPHQFMEILGALSFENAFNPYVDRCLVHDVDDAPMLRRNALLSIIEAAAETEVDAIWIGRDLGYRGGRRTGLALTDDIHIQAHAERWGITVSRPTKGQIVAERTAAVIWSVLAQTDAHVFLWNVFPLHPHESTDPFSNRTHNARERRAGEDLLFSLIKLLAPRRLIAIGNDAFAAARRLCEHIEVVQVRHPSYGGQTQFLSAMNDLYCLTRRNEQRRLL